MKLALITGASSGIGKDFALLFAKKGFDVLLVARRKGKLDEVAHMAKSYGVNAYVCVADLSQGIAPVLSFVKKHKLRVHTVVANAGFGQRGDFVLADQVRIEQMIRLNIESLTLLIRAFLPDVLSQQGGILTIASVAGFVPGPYMAVYFASKAYVISFTLALAQELRGRVRVSVLCPGATATEFADVAQMGPMPFAASSASVAQSGYDALKYGRTLVVTGFTNKVTVFVSRFVSRNFLARIVARLLG